jgi:hypothetical protein
MKTLFETGILKYGKRETSSTASKTRWSIVCFYLLESGI